MKYKLRGLREGAHGKMTIGKEYDINEHNMFYDDQGDRCTKSFYDWSMPDSINIAVSDGSKPNKPIHSRTPNQPDVPSNNATNGGYTPYGLGQVEEHTDDFKTLADLPIVTGETFLREPENSGGSCDYYTIRLLTEHDGHVVAFNVTCEDVMDKLSMTFNEGTAFKSLWRKAAARQGKLKANNTALRDAEKICHSSKRILAEEQANV